MCVICVMGRGAMTHMTQPGAGCLSPRRPQSVPANRPAGKFIVSRGDNGRAPMLPGRIVTPPGRRGALSRHARAGILPLVFHEGH